MATNFLTTMSVDSSVSIASFLSRWFNKNGAVYFEHGYSIPTFMVGGHPVHVTHISKQGIHGYHVDEYGKRHVVTHCFDDLKHFQQMRIVFIINDYMLYVKYES